jgi:hypothetical protein
MSRHLLLTFSNPAGGREDEFNDWYTHTHLDEVLAAVPGFKSAQRFRLEPGTRMTGDTPDAPYRYLALYEVEGDALQEVDAALYDLARGERDRALAEGREPPLTVSTAMDRDMRTWWFTSISEERTP